MNKQIINKADYSGDAVELVSYKNGHFRAEVSSYITGTFKLVDQRHGKVTLNQGTVIDVIQLDNKEWYAIIDWNDDYTSTASDPITAAFQLAFNVI